MRIGILTFHRAHNYGALLQAYALKTYLTSLGHEVSFVDYWPEWHANAYRIWNKDAFQKASLGGKIKMLVVFILTLSRRYRRVRGFESFMRNYLNLPKTAKYTKASICFDENHDLIVVGSDQVWRNWIKKNIYIGFDPIYFAEGLPRQVKYITYAASMGIIDYNSEEEKFLRDVLSNFSKISVREKTLQTLLSDLGYQSEIVADPVFLLSKEQWNALLPSKRFMRDKYVLFYRLVCSDEASILAHEIAKKMNCRLITITATVPLLPHKDELQTSSPLQFLHALRDAEFVIATSFHGTAFSIIFEKPFYVMGLGKNADRVISLLNRLRLENRYLLHPSDKEKKVDNAMGSFDSQKNEYVNASKSFLLDSIKIDKRCLVKTYMIGL